MKINPYKSVDLKDVAVANFHGHTKIWSGLTNGKGKAADLHRRYDSLGHDFHAVSQYHHIDTALRYLKNYIPAYEHGYNLKKTHQLVIGSRQVVWKDYVFPQTVHNKQELLIRLAKDTNNIVVLNHPAIRNGYTIEDLKKLHYYDYIELLNPSAQSIAHWDTILSSGKKVFAMGNDDVHDVFNDNAMGRFITLIYGTGKSRNNMISSLKKGASAAVWLPQVHGENLMQKRKRIEDLKNIIKSFDAQDSGLNLQLNGQVDTIKLFTDHGVLKSLVVNANAFHSVFHEHESYWRIEIIKADGTRIFFNPVYRHADGYELARNEKGNVNVSRNKGNPTLALFLGIFIMLLGSNGVSLKKRNARNQNKWFALLKITR